MGYSEGCSMLYLEAALPAGNPWSRQPGRAERLDFVHCAVGSLPGASGGGVGGKPGLHAGPGSRLRKRRPGLAFQYPKPPSS
jgi:hypothetical protein